MSGFSAEVKRYGGAVPLVTSPLQVIGAPICRLLVIDDFTGDLLTLWEK
jgi:hypothetical protein